MNFNNIGFFIWRGERLLLLRRLGKSKEEMTLPVAAIGKIAGWRKKAKERLKKITGLEVAEDKIFSLPHVLENARIRLCSVEEFSGKPRAKSKWEPAWIRISDLSEYPIDPIVADAVKKVFGISAKSKYRLD